MPSFCLCDYMNTPSLYLCGVVTLVLLTTANATIMLPSSCIFPLIALLVNTLMQIGSPHSISSLAMFSVIHSSGHAADGHGMHKERKKQAREVVKVEKKIETLSTFDFSDRNNLLSLRSVFRQTPSHFYQKDICGR